jgi:hypothetical protein
VSEDSQKNKANYFYYYKPLSYSSKRVCLLACLFIERAKSAALFSRRQIN